MPNPRRSSIEVFAYVEFPKVSHKSIKLIKVFYMLISAMLPRGCVKKDVIGGNVNNLLTVVNEMLGRFVNYAKRSSFLVLYFSSVRG